MSVEAFQRVSGPKEPVWIDGATHLDLYDRDAYVTPGGGKPAGFFR
ncbi:hypothetical protein AB0N16_25385 [Streptomyces sp. NPDC051105]